MLCAKYYSVLKFASRDIRTEMHMSYGHLMSTSIKFGFGAINSLNISCNYIFIPTYFPLKKAM